MASRKHTTPTQLDLSFDHAEEWRDVPGYEGYYQVSSLGRVRSLERRVRTSRNPDKSRISPGRFMRLKVCQPHLYLSVMFSKEGKKKEWFVHHLVLMAFVGPRPAGMICNHLDSDRQNNAPTNLEWVTYLENSHHSIRKGRWHPFLLRGERASWTKLTEAQVRDIRIRVAQGTSMYSLAREFSVANSTIAKIVHRERRKDVP